MAGNRTFVVFAVTSPTGNFVGSDEDVTLTGTGSSQQIYGTAALTPGTKADVKPKVAYRATIPPENQTGGVGCHRHRLLIRVLIL